MTPLIPFSSVNNSLYKYYLQTGQEGLANEVLNLQINELRQLASHTGHISVLPAGVTKDHPAYIAYKGKKGSGSTMGNTQNTSTNTGSDDDEDTGETSGNEGAKVDTQGDGGTETTEVIVEANTGEGSSSSS